MKHSLLEAIKNIFQNKKVLNQDEQISRIPSVKDSLNNTQHTKNLSRNKNNEKVKAKPGNKKPAALQKWDISEFKVDPAEGKVRFHDFALPNGLMRAIYEAGYKYCTPIQAQILPAILKGKDATGRAQTGTGKTAAFLIAVFTRFINNKTGTRKPGRPRAVIIAPTRELVMQIGNDARMLSKYLRFRTVTVFGGINYKKQQALLREKPVDIIVATPGRLLDFISKRIIMLKQTEVLVIDEADRMLDMGFIPDVRKIVRATPDKSKRQTLFFSATLSSQVKRLASSWTSNALNVEIESKSVAAESIEQIVYIVTDNEKTTILFNLIEKQNLERVIIFTNRKDEAKELEYTLYRRGINCNLISGDVDQRNRIKILDKFKSGELRVLVATDVAGRGLHIENISHVINFSLPEDPEDYVHRIGRTGRAGASGISVSFASEEDSFQLPDIEKLLGYELKCSYPDKTLLETMPAFIREYKPMKKPFKKPNYPKPAKKRRYKK